MELIPYGPDDRWLTAAIDGDDEMMKHLGGAIAEDKIDALHEHRAADVDWFFKIVLPEGVAGTIGIWPSDGHYETGWCVLPAFQGKGVASRALALLLEKAGRTFPEIHAYPPVDNAPSNGLCRKFGFTLVREFEDDFRGHKLQMNDWVLVPG